MNNTQRVQFIPVIDTTGDFENYPFRLETFDADKCVFKKSKELIGGGYIERLPLGKLVNGNTLFLHLDDCCNKKDHKYGVAIMDMYGQSHTVMGDSVLIQQDGEMSLGFDVTEINSLLDYVYNRMTCLKFKA